MSVAVMKISGRCPQCDTVHGTTPWEKSYWRARWEAMRVPLVDGGPIREVALRCSKCEKTDSSGATRR